MCGRYSQTKSKEDIKIRFNVANIADSVECVYNISPTQNVPVILNESPNEVTLAQWGLIPSWSKVAKMQYSMINARAETLFEKPAYKRLLKSKRCLVIADSFYEWKKVGEKKVPHRILFNHENLFAFAGLWDAWEKEGSKILSCTIITTSSNELVSPIHDRMPVILDRESENLWLNEPDNERVMKLLKPCSTKNMKSYPISTTINNPRNNSFGVCLELQ
jgi:putative SOS response-associated peptidase YedK